MPRAGSLHEPPHPHARGTCPYHDNGTGGRAVLTAQLISHESTHDQGFLFEGIETLS